MLGDSGGRKTNDIYLFSATCFSAFSGHPETAGTFTGVQRRWEEVQEDEGMLDHWEKEKSKLRFLGNLNFRFLRLRQGGRSPYEC